MIRDKIATQKTSNLVRKKKILIVDDEQFNRMAVEVILESLGINELN